MLFALLVPFLVFSGYGHYLLHQYMGHKKIYKDVNHLGEASVEKTDSQCELTFAHFLSEIETPELPAQLDFTLTPCFCTYSSQVHGVDLKTIANKGPPVSQFI